MNRCHRLLWSRCRHCLVVVAEQSKERKSRKGSALGMRRLFTTSLLATSFGCRTKCQCHG
ncbi:ESPR-type extended signal peptide-containing protein [Vreelandella sp. H-I2]